PSFRVLASPPSLASCTRDCYAPQQRFDAERVLKIAAGVASVMQHLHARGILHGDLYGHNLLVDPSGRTLLSDFGAASFHDPPAAAGRALQRLKARAFGCLLGALLERCEDAEQDPHLQRLAELRQQCLLDPPLQRPDFGSLVSAINAIG